MNNRRSRSALMMATLYSGYFAGVARSNSRRGPDPLDEVDIDAEMERIRQKKSGLSALQRARVKAIWESRHRKEEA